MKVTVESKQQFTDTSSLEDYFKPFRNNIVGMDTMFQSPYGNKKIK